MEKRYDYITPTDYETAELNGVTKSALEQRVFVYMWDVGKAVTVPLKTRSCFQSTWKEWESVAIKNGVNKRLFYSRVHYQKWSCELAANEKVVRGRPLSIEWTKEERETAKRNGLDKNHMTTVKARIRNGWTREDAINTPLVSESERAKRVAEGTRAYKERRKKNETNHATSQQRCAERA